MSPTVYLVDLATPRPESLLATALDKAPTAWRSLVERFVRPADRLRKLGSLALASHMLGEGRLLTPDVSEPRGKPCFAERPDFHFNLSHSGGFVAGAAGGRPVGIDIEQVRAFDDPLELAERFFAPDEAALIRARRGGDRVDLFLTLWTMKESVAKADGGGLANSLRDFSVVASLNDPAASVTLNGRRWYVQRLPMLEGYKMSLCVIELGPPHDIIAADLESLLRRLGL